MEKIKILWVDDEIDLLKPHITFLEGRGYDVSKASGGVEALELVESQNFDIVFLDENMPGISGLEVLNRIKTQRSHLPVIMITKSEEEHIMEDAIGSKIADYLIKPVNPNQILLSLKKILDGRRIVGEKTTQEYRQEFMNIGMSLSDRMNSEEWKEVYKKLIYWEMELTKTPTGGMEDILLSQKEEANNLFCKYVERNYKSWVQGKSDDTPLLSHTLFKNRIAPSLNGENTIFWIVIDNLRYDQWKAIQPLIQEDFRIDSEDIFYAILPTATQYARNALFAGLMPSEIEKRHPKLWVGEDEEGGKNMHEEELLNEQLKRLGKNIKMSYHKITNLQSGKKLVENMHKLNQNKLNVIVYNFVDMLSHARTDMEVIRELADDEAAYRSITQSWFEHSPLREILKEIARAKGKVFLCTDHGTIRVKEPSKVVGDRETTTNLRYKMGKNLRYEGKDVFDIGDPAEIFLPKVNISSRYIFAKGSKFLAYPNNYNYYVNFYKNTFQHGGISLEEMLIPLVSLEAK